MKQIPFFSLARQGELYKENFKAALDKIVDTQQFIGGQTVEQFEKKLASYVGATNAIACNSGTDALWLALDVLNVSSRTIVLTTPFSFIASSSEIVAHGGHPVFIDIDKKTYNICPKKLKSWLELNAVRVGGQTIHKETGLQIGGIVTVDLFGQCADYVAIKELANAWGLWIVEDACQAIGASMETAPGLTQKTGTLGDITAFSFYPTKNLGAFGDGGALTTNNPMFAEKLLQLRNHGRKTHYDYKCLGINSRLDGLQAAILSTKLDLLDLFSKQRRMIAETYSKELAGLEWLVLPEQKTGYHVFHQYSVQILGDRDAFAAHLASQGIETRIFYPKALNQIDYLKTDARLINPCPAAEDVINQIISLPVWPELSQEEVLRICDAVRSFDLIKPSQELFKTATL